jgi:hypothetical protein
MKEVKIRVQPQVPDKHEPHGWALVTVHTLWYPVASCSLALGTREDDVSILVQYVSVWLTYTSDYNDLRIRLPEEHTGFPQQSGPCSCWMSNDHTSCRICGRYQ